MQFNDPKKGACAKFLSSKDMYAKPINLSYNYKKKYPTTCGGIMTMITLLFMVHWLASQILGTIKSNYTEHTQLSLMPDANSNSEAPVLNITSKELIVAHHF
jgi:hypothetical protein